MGVLLNPFASFPAAASGASSFVGMWSAYDGNLTSWNLSASFPSVAILGDSANADVYDYGGWINGATTGGGVVVIPSGVSYAVILAQLHLQNITANARIYMQLYKNGSAAPLPNLLLDDTLNSTTPIYQVQTPPLAVTPGDTFTIYGFANDTSGDMLGGSTATWLAAYKVG